MAPLTLPTLPGRWLQRKKAYLYQALEAQKGILDSKDGERSLDMRTSSAIFSLNWQWNLVCSFVS